MMTWRLWQGLCTPFVAHPIYWQRGVWRQPRPNRFQQKMQTLLRQYKPLLWVLLGVSLVIIGLVFGPSALTMIFLGMPALMVFLFPPIYLLSIGLVYGLACALAVSDTIAVEKQQGRYVLLGLTPYGIAGAIWALGTLVQQTHEPLKWLRNTLTLIYMVVGGLLGLPLIVGLFILLFYEPMSNTGAFAFTFNVLNVTLLVCIPLLDYIQSTNVGCLVGMITPTLTNGRANTRGYTLFIFLSLQLGGYLLAALLCFVLWPRVYHLMGWPLDMGYSLMCVITLYILREALTLVLWHYLAHCLEIDLAEMQAATRI